MSSTKYRLHRGGRPGQGWYVECADRDDVALACVDEDLTAAGVISRRIPSGPFYFVPDTDAGKDATRAIIEKALGPSASVSDG